MSFVYRYLPSEIPVPTLLVLHGTGGDEDSLVPLAQTLSPEAPILSVRGRIEENGMPRFFRRFAEGIFDYDNIRSEADALATFLHTLPEAQVEMVALGYSNGANMAWSTVLRHPDVITGGILLRPMVTLDDTADLSGKRFFVSAGRFDPIVPTENVDRLIAQMKALGADVTVNWVEGGHQLTREEIALAKAWLG